MTSLADGGSLEARDAGRGIRENKRRPQRVGHYTHASNFDGGLAVVTDDVGRDTKGWRTHDAERGARANAATYGAGKGVDGQRGIHIHAGGGTRLRDAEEDGKGAEEIVASAASRARGVRVFLPGPHSSVPATSGPSTIRAHTASHRYVVVEDPCWKQRGSEMEHAHRSIGRGDSGCIALARSWKSVKKTGGMEKATRVKRGWVCVKGRMKERIVPIQKSAPAARRLEIDARGAAPVLDLSHRTEPRRGYISPEARYGNLAQRGKDEDDAPGVARRLC
ncbi:hypothetical protein B0H13DRAFT_1878670 [Mycena leptocephala]|nr:hypothetical protein B0H13DRAFT_1878670 [Mycena leptocephala]